MADPVPIVRTFMSEPSITEDLRLDAVVTMADAKNLLGRLDDQIEMGKINEAYQQIAFADKIILNKLDLVTAEQAIAVKDRIRSINKFAKVVPAIKGRVKMSEFGNIRAHDIGNFAEIDLEKEAEDVPVVQGHEAHGGHEGHESHGGHGGHGVSYGHDSDPRNEQVHGTGHGHGSEASRHDNRVGSFAIVREGEIDPRRLTE